MKKANQDIRKAIRKSGLYQYEIAEKMGVRSDATFTRWLRFELEDEKKEQIYRAIKELRKERSA